MELETERLIIRQWQGKDYRAFSAMNQDPEVMRFFSKPMSPEESQNLAEKFRSIISRQGWGFWALELKSEQRFIGFCGLHYQPDKFSFSPCTEIGWRLSRDVWRQGLATEAAKTVMKFAFTRLYLPQLVAFTSLGNHRSEAVMQRLNMQRQRTFAHPHLPIEHPLSMHVLYAIQAKRFFAENKASAEI